MKRIKLTRGKFVLVDDEDFEWLSQIKWLAIKPSGLFYAARSSFTGDYVNNHGKYELIYMHRFIMNAGSSQQVDHQNGNGLDNRRKNLRFSSQLQNTRNSKKQKDTSSRYKGVCWDKARNKWRVEIKATDNRLHLGRFDDEIEAAKTYDHKAGELFGEFARLNFPAGGECENL